MEPPVKKNSLLNICQYLQAKAVTNTDHSVDDSNAATHHEDDFSLPGLPQPLMETIKPVENMSRPISKNKRKLKTKPVKLVKNSEAIKQEDEEGSQGEEADSELGGIGFVVENESGTVFNLNDILNDSFDNGLENEVKAKNDSMFIKHSIKTESNVCDRVEWIEKGPSVTPKKSPVNFRRNPTSRKRGMGIRKGNTSPPGGETNMKNYGIPQEGDSDEFTLESTKKRKCHVNSDEIKLGKNSRKSKKKGNRFDSTSSPEAPHPLFSHDPEIDIDPEIEEELCLNGKCLFNAFQDIYMEGYQVMKRTPFLACRICRNPYLNTGALLQHLVKKHSVTENKYIGVHICIAHAAEYFKKSNVRSSDLPMEFRGTCWLDKCEYGCCRGAAVADVQVQMLKPVACKVCRIPYGSVAGIFQHIEREHDLYLLRHYLHICPDIYRTKSTTEDVKSDIKMIKSEEKLDIDEGNSVISDRINNVLEKNETTRLDSGEHKEAVSIPKDNKETKTSTTTSSASHMITRGRTKPPVSKSAVHSTLSIPLARGNRMCLNSKNQCRYSCSTKDKLLRQVKMAHIMACKQCCIPYYAIGSFQNHCVQKHTGDRHQVHKYLHICTPTIVEYFDSIKKQAGGKEVPFFRRWYFYDNCQGNCCEFGCTTEKPFACKVCQDTYILAEDAVQHIEETHDTVSIKPLLHICPSMLGDPPIRPMGQANKHKAITHHSYVPIPKESTRQFATPIRPIQRKGSRLPNPCEGLAASKDNADQELVIQVSFKQEAQDDLQKMGDSIGGSEEVGGAYSGMTDRLVLKVEGTGGEEDVIGSEEMGGAYGGMTERSVNWSIDEGGVTDFSGIQTKIKQEPSCEDYLSNECSNLVKTKENNLKSDNDLKYNIKNEPGLLKSFKTEPEFDFPENPGPILKGSYCEASAFTEDNMISCDSLSRDIMKNQSKDFENSVEDSRVIGEVVNDGFGE